MQQPQEEEESPGETSSGGAVVVGGGLPGQTGPAESGQHAVPEVSLQTLLANGAISPDDFAAAVNAASADGRGQIIGEDGQLVRYVVRQEAEEEEGAAAEVKEEPPPEKEAADKASLTTAVAGGGDPQHSQRIVVQCGKCGVTFDAEDFETHWEEAHATDRDAAFEEAGDTKTCSICYRRFTSNDYLTHFKVGRLGKSGGVYVFPSSLSSLHSKIPVVPESSSSFFLTMLASHFLPVA